MMCGPGGIALALPPPTDTHMLKALLAAFLLQLPLSALACDGLVDKLNAQLKYPPAYPDPIRVFSDCAVMPNDPGRAIVALAHFKSGSGFDNDRAEMGLYDLDVLVVDSKSGKILNRLLQEGALTSDAVQLSGIAIDTANYAVAPGARAFGVRVHYDHPKRYYPHQNEVLTLYLARGATLAPILTDFETINSGGEVGDCEGVLTDIRRSLAIARTATRGLADLLVTAKTFVVTRRDVGGECTERQGPTTTARHTLRYNGSAYLPPTAQH